MYQKNKIISSFTRLGPTNKLLENMILYGCICDDQHACIHNEKKTSYE